MTFNARLKKLERTMIGSGSDVVYLFGAIGGRFPDHEAEKRDRIAKGLARESDQFICVTLRGVKPPDYEKDDHGWVH